MTVLHIIGIVTLVLLALLPVAFIHQRWVEHRRKKNR